MTSRGFVQAMAWLTAAVLVVAACGSEGDDDSQPSDADNADTAGTTAGADTSGLVGTNDEVVVVDGPGGEFRLSVPAGAVESGAEITISELPPADDLGGYEGVARRFRLEPSGLRFSEPATFTLTMPASDVSVDDAPVFTPAFLRDGTTVETVPTETMRVGDDLVIAAEIPHFSELELFPAADRSYAGKFTMTPARTTAEYDVPFRATADALIDEAYVASDGAEWDEADVLGEAVGINRVVGGSVEQVVGDPTDRRIEFHGEWVCRRGERELADVADQYGMRVRWAPIASLNVLELIAIRLGAAETDLPDILEKSKWTLVVAGVVECVEPGSAGATTTTTVPAATTTTTTTVAAGDDATGAIGAGVDTHVEVPDVEIDDPFFLPTDVETFRDEVGNVYVLFCFLSPVTPDRLTDFDVYSRAIEVAAGPPENPNTFLELTQHDGEFSMSMSRDRADLWITEDGKLLWDTGLATEGSYEGEAVVDLFAQSTESADRQADSFSFRFGSELTLTEQGAVDVAARFPNRIKVGS